MKGAVGMKRMITRGTYHGVGRLWQWLRLRPGLRLRCLWQGVAVPAFPTLGLAALMLVMSACEELAVDERDNPRDPGAEDPLDWEITDVTVNEAGEGEQVDVRDLNISWNNDDDRLEFQVRVYFLASAGYLPEDPEAVHTSGWMDDTQYQVQVDREGHYLLEITPRWADQPQVQEDPGDISFIVNTLPDNALRFKEDLHVSAQWLTVDLWVHNAVDLFAGEFTVAFDNEALELVGVNGAPGESMVGSFFDSIAHHFGFSQIVVPDFSDEEVLDRANMEGAVDVGTSLLTRNGEEVAFSNHGSVLRLYFDPLQSGTTTIEIDEQRSELFNQDEDTLDVGQVEPIEVNL